MFYHIDIKNRTEKSCTISIYNVTKDTQIRLDAICIYFVLEGTVKITTNTESEVLSEDDLLLINSFTPHKIESKTDNIIYCLQINPEYYTNFYKNFYDLKFELNSLNCDESEKQNITLIKYIMSKIIEIIDLNEKSYLISAEQYLHELVKLLLNKSSLVKNSNTDLMQSEEKRLSKILKYINSHYTEPLTLKSLSEIEHLNSQYFSRFFSKNMGITLKAYIFKVRLQKSLEDLINTDKLISSIALDNGFSDFKSYFKEFKKEFNMTPGKYRILYKNKPNAYLSNKKNSIMTDIEIIMKKLHHYLSLLSINNDFLCFQVVNSHGGLPEIRNDYSINYKKSSENLNKSWKTVARCDMAVEILTSRWRNQFEDIHNSIKFNYILIRNIFCNELVMHNVSTLGLNKYNFDLIDEIINYLLSINVVPFIEIGFIPGKLSLKNNSSNSWKINKNYPDDLKVWEQLVNEFFIHLFETYDFEILKTWQFQIWYNPDWKKSHDVNLINKFLEATSNGIIQANDNHKYLKIGLLYYCEYDNNETISIDNYILNSLNLSFISISLFNAFFNDDYPAQNSLSQKLYINNKIINNAFIQIKERLSQLDLNNNDIYIMDWNGYFMYKDLLNDTCFKASFILKRILEYYKKANLIVDNLFPNETINKFPSFDGDNSLITRSGLKKAPYNTYLLLNMLGEKILMKGDDFLVTKKKNESLQILVQNFCQLSQKLILENSKKISLYERSYIFDAKIKAVNFIIKGISGKAQIKTYRLNRDNGSVYDEWINMGSPNKLTDEDLQYLNSKSIYDTKIKSIETNKDFCINEKMRPHEILLIEICLL